jgi:serine/threonine protein kinase
VDPSPVPSIPAEERVLAGRYRLERRLAIGGMAEVWVATDLVLDRPVAVKMLRRDIAGDPTVIERFRREAVAVARLNHPCIVRVFDTVNDAGADAVVMELVDGKTLREVLDEDKRLGAAATIHVGIALADALDAAHRAGIIHRDVKPANVLLTREGRVLLTDFGIATALSGGGDLTRENVMMGTAKYLSPEQVLGIGLDGRSDLFSLGIVLYECLTGQVPFAADNDAATALARLQREALPVRTIRPGISRGLDDLVMRCLARSADHRPASAAMVRDRLQRLETEPVDEDPTLVVPRDPTPSLGTLRPVTAVQPQPAASAAAPMAQRRWLTAVVVVCLVALGLGVAGAVLASTDSGSRLLQRVRKDITGSEDHPPLDTAPPATAPKVTTQLTASLFDPQGDGSESSAGVAAVVDGDPGSSWSSRCYASADMRPKTGIGIAITLDRSAAGRKLEVTSPSVGWSARLYVADRPGATAADWGEPTATLTEIQSSVTSFDIGPHAGRSLLLWVTRLAPATSGCTRPWQITIDEMRIVG